MPQKLNSAARILRILEKASSVPDNTQALEGWAKILGIDEGNPNKLVLIVSDQIAALSRELDLTATGMEAAQFPKTLYDGVIDKVRHAISPMVFPSEWSQVRVYFGPDVLTSFAYCSEILPDEESIISDADLKEIELKAAELKKSLDDTSIPPRLRKLIEHHVELILRALREYPVAGAKAFREAGREALGEIIEARDEIAPERNTPVVSKLEATWKKVNEAADIAFKAEKIGQLGQRAWEALGTIL